MHGRHVTVAKEVENKLIKRLEVGGGEAGGRMGYQACMHRGGSAVRWLPGDWRWLIRRSGGQRGEHTVGGIDEPELAVDHGGPPGDDDALPSPWPGTDDIESGGEAGRQGNREAGNQGISEQRGREQRGREQSDSGRGRDC